MRRFREAIAFLVAPWLREQRRDWDDLAVQWREVAKAHRAVAAAAEDVRRQGRALLEESAQ